MNIISLRETDLEALQALCQRAMPGELWTVELLRRRLLGDPGLTPAYQLACWDEGHLVGALIGTTRPLSDGPVAGVLLLAVDPPSQRQGIGSRLLAALEERARADRLARLRVGGLAPNYLWAGLDLRYTPALCFFERHGFTRVGEGLNMAVDLAAASWDTSAAEARLAERGWEVRRLGGEDRPSFEAWLQAEWNDSWLYEGLDAYHNDPVSAFVAAEHGRIRAFGCYNVSGFANTFGPTGAEQAARGLGLGRILLHRCFADLQALGFGQAEIGWVGPIAFYAHNSGATINRVFWFFDKPL